jgi:hypothetical protein
MKLTKTFMLALAFSAFAYPTTLEACKIEQRSDNKWYVTYAVKNHGETSSGCSSPPLDSRTDATDWVKNYCSSKERTEPVAEGSDGDGGSAIV